jgi:hypothetical protein
MPQVKSFTRKQLRVTFILAGNVVFQGTNSNTLILSGLRCIVNVKCAGAFQYSTASVQVFGMRQSDMNALTMLGWQRDAVQRNRIIIEANDGSGWLNVFSGTIYEAGPDYSCPPDALLRVEANSLFVESLIPATPSSYPGTVDVATIVSNIAAAMSRTFENNGVDVQLHSPYLPNTLPEQLRTVCEQAGIDFYDDSTGGILAITPRGQPRRTPLVHINPSSGLITQPTVDAAGIQLVTLYNPGYRFGGPVSIENTNIPKANGKWFIYALDHCLESEMPGGSWISHLSCSTSPTLSVAP